MPGRLCFWGMSSVYTSRRITALKGSTSCEHSPERNNGNSSSPKPRSCCSNWVRSKTAAKMYRFTLQTKAGRLRLHPDADQHDGPGTVFTCFDDPQAARQFVDCNRFSGKWNFHYFDGWTVETAIKDFSARLRLVLA